MSNIWPGNKGDHHGAYRSSALGAQRGELRARWSVPRGLSLREICVTSLDIIVSCPGVLFMVDAHGAARREILLPDDSWLLRGISADALLVSSNEKLRGLDHAGNLLWERTLAGPIVAVSPAADGGFACLTNSHPPLKPLRLSRFAPDASLRWESERLPVGIGLQRFSLAFDDSDILYVHSFGRLGDGVSGEDTPVGGLSALSSTGELLWKLPQTLEKLSLELFGRGAGVFLRGASVSLCSPDGTLSAPTQERSLRVGEREFSMSEGAPMLTMALSTSSKVAQLISFDGAMNVYANFEGVLFGLDKDLAVRWSTQGGATYTPPIIGPERTILLNLRTELLIVE